MDTVEYRRVRPGDLPEILLIEDLSFPTPWDIQTFLSLLSEEESYDIAAVYHGKIIGYCFSTALKRMVHLLNLAVHPDCQRNGIARSLMSKVISFARNTNKSYVFLEVRKRNAVAQSLYTSMGFSHVCTWHRYYTDTGEDAFIMVKKIEETA